MSNRKPVVLIGIVLLLLGVGAYFGLFRGLFGPPSPQVQREATLRKDRENLEKKDATVGEVRAALLRLSSTQDPAVFDQALRFVGDSSPEVRSAVAYAVGRYPGPKSIEVLRKLMEDSSADVRRDAIRSAAMVQEPGRREMIERLRGKNAASAGERIAFWEAVLRWSGDSAAASAKDKAEALGELQNFAKVSDAAIRSQAVGVLVARLRDEPRVRTLLKDQLQSGLEPSDRVMALHHLVALHDAWILENFAKYLGPTAGPELQAASLQLIGSACPANRWEVLESRIADASGPAQLRMSAVHGLRSLGGVKAYGMLKQAIDGGKFQDPSLKDFAVRMLSEMEATRSQPERCQGQKAS